VIDPDLRKAEDEGWHELHALIDSLPPGAAERPGYYEEGWSAKDLLAHIGAWLAQAGVALEQIGAGTYRPEEIDVDALNGRFLEVLRDLPFEVVRAQADASRSRMLLASATAPPGDPDAAFWIRKAGPDHYNEHLPRLRQWSAELAVRVASTAAGSAAEVGSSAPAAAAGGTPVGPAVEPAGVDLAAVEARRGELVAQYLRPAGERPESSARGVHHIALLSSDVEQTIRFYQELLEFPLTEIFENRDYQGSNHFFFDIGNGNLLAFFDFPGLDLGPYAEVLGGLHHLAISVSPEKWTHLRGKLEAAGVEYVIHSGASIYFCDPDGARLELLSDPLGDMYGSPVL
jgi:catechol 2,3-dioxygenase-like lactoylglutathione lyase family enzyme